MSEGILTKSQDMDGAVIVSPIIHSEDGYNVASSNIEILRLQICKSQVTQDLSNDCISVIQKNIVTNESHPIQGMFAMVVLTIMIVGVMWGLFNRFIKE